MRGDHIPVSGHPSSRNSTSFSMAPIAETIGWGSIIGIHLCYLLAAHYEQVPWCIPYWDSCTSISATGRNPPAFFVFKAIMLPIAGLTLVYWPLVSFWLCRLGQANNLGNNALTGKTNSIIRFGGLTAGLALILYTTMLGAVGETYQLQRRIGITLFFGFTGLCHLLTVSQLAKLPPSGRPSGYRIQLILSSALVFGGIFSATLALTMQDYGEIEDAFEWCFALVMMSQFIVTGATWRRTGFTIK